MTNSRGLGDMETPFLVGYSSDGESSATFGEETSITGEDARARHTVSISE
jgi:hypothetical protein